MELTGKLIRKPNQVIGLESDNRFRQVRELPLIISEFCSHFSFKDYEFLTVNEQPGFYGRLAVAFPDALVLVVKAASFHNGFGHFYTEADYRRLGHNLIYSLSVFASNKLRSEIVC